MASLKNKLNVWPQNPLTKFLGIKYPIIQAPMANCSSPKMVAEISNSGGLGSFGGGYLSPQRLRESVREIKKLTEAPYHINLFVYDKPLPNNSLIQNMRKILQPFKDELKVIEDADQQFSMPNFEEQVEVLLRERVPICSFAFGFPNPDVIKKLKKQGTKIIGTANTLREAIVLEYAGFDAIVAQGSEAGGHRAYFLVDDTRYQETLVGVSSLVSQIVGEVRIPVIAAGGIMDGAAVVSMLNLGASAASLGTVFLASKESTASSEHKKILLKGGESTTITRAFSGRAARVIKNNFTEKMKEHDKIIPHFPYQHELTRLLRDRALKSNNPEYLALFAGQGYSKCTNETTTEIFQRILKQISDLK